MFLSLKDKLDIARNAILEWMEEKRKEDYMGYKPICRYGSYNFHKTDCKDCYYIDLCEEEQTLENPGDVWDYGDWE